MISAWQAARANREARRAVAAEGIARQRLTESEAISKFMTEVFQSPDPSRDGRAIKVVELLEKAARKLETDLATEPAQRARLQGALGRTYFGLGLYRDAIPLHEKVREYFLTTSGPEHTNTLNAAIRLAECYQRAGRNSEALRVAEEARALFNKVLGPEHPDTLVAADVLANSYDVGGRREDALNLRQQLLTLRQKVSGPEHPDTLTAMNNLAHSYVSERRDAAVKLFEKVLTLNQKVMGPEHPNTLTAMNNLAISLAQRGRLSEAVDLLEKVLTLRQRVDGPEHPDTLRTMNSLSFFYVRTKRGDDALKLREERLEQSRKNDPDSPATAAAYAGLGFTFNDLGRRDDAIKAWQEAVRIDPIKDVIYWLGRSLFERERYEEALPILRATQKSFPDDDRGREAAYRLAESEFWLTDAKAETNRSPATSVSPSVGKWLTTIRQQAAANPADTDKAKQLATIHLWLGQTNEHQAICRKLLEEAANSKDPTVHDRAAKSYLIQANPDPETSRLAVASGRQALRLAGAYDENRSWFIITAAIAEVRAQKPTEAEDLLNGLLTNGGLLAKPDDNKERRVFALAWRAIARAQQNRLSEARADLAELEPLLPRFAEPPAGWAVFRSADVMAAFLARAEARALLNSPPTTKQ